MPTVNLAGRAHTPADYDEVFRRYFPLIHRIATRWVDPHTADDIAMSLMLHFMERDGLRNFDPQRITLRTGLPQPVPFAVYLAAYAQAQAWTLHRAWLRGRRREVLVAEFSEDVLGAAPSPENLIDDGSNKDALDRLCEIVSVRVPGQRRRIKDLPAVLRHMAAQVEVLGRVDMPRLAKHFKVSLVTAYSWRAQIIALLDEVAP